jgi:hypothetical protein
MAIKQYDGQLGKFEYDDTEFKHLIFRDGRKECLMYIGNESDGSKIKIPQGIKDCSFMFDRCESLETPPVIPEGVEDCSVMFSDCRNLEVPPIIPSSVKKCDAMFYYARCMRESPVIPEGVEDCTLMFQGCYNMRSAPVIPHSVKDTTCMFCVCSRKVSEAGEWNIEHRGQSYESVQKRHRDAENKLKEFEEKEESSTKSRRGFHLPFF